MSRHQIHEKMANQIGIIGCKILIDSVNRFHKQIKWFLNPNKQNTLKCNDFEKQGRTEQRAMEQTMISQTGNVRNLILRLSAVVANMRATKTSQQTKPEKASQQTNPRTPVNIQNSRKPVNRQNPNSSRTTSSTSRQSKSGEKTQDHFPTRRSH